MTSIDRDPYGALYGSTVRDRLRLAATDLWLEVEEDRCVGGDEAVFGGGKTIHESMLRGSRTASRGPDVVIMNVVVLDHRGVVRYDVGIREGRISALVKLANPTSPTACTPTSDRAHDDGPRDHRVCGEARSRKRRARSWRCSRRRRHDRRRCRRES